ncbi:MAG: hypothetical protein MAG453_01514 [Calditrichaeota bacterium]|nr:hypothetical protein [Calditrichota bacterium]
MPTYTYHCTECGHEFDLFHGISEHGDRECPVCHGVARRRIGRGAGLIFKGSGFYETDYKRNGSSPSTNGAEGRKSRSSSSDGEPESSGASESTPAAGKKKEDKPA